MPFLRVCVRLRRVSLYLFEQNAVCKQALVNVFFYLPFKSPISKKKCAKICPLSQEQNIVNNKKDALVQLRNVPSPLCCPQLSLQHLMNDPPVQSYTYSQFLQQCNSHNDTVRMRMAARSALCFLASLSIKWCAQWPSYKRLQKQVPYLHDNVLIPLPLSQTMQAQTSRLNEWPAQLGFLTTEWPAKMCFLVLMYLYGASVEATLLAQIKDIEATFKVDENVETSPLYMTFNKGRGVWNKEYNQTVGFLRESLLNPKNERIHIPRAFFAWFAAFICKAENQSVRVYNRPLFCGAYPPKCPFHVCDASLLLEYDPDTTYKDILLHVMPPDWSSNGAAALGRRLLSWSALCRQWSPARSEGNISGYIKEVETSTSDGCTLLWEKPHLLRLALELEFWPQTSCTHVWSLTELEGLSYLNASSHGHCIVYHRVKTVNCHGLWLVDMQTKQNELYVMGADSGYDNLWKLVESKYEALGLQAASRAPIILPLSPEMPVFEPSLAFLHVLRCVLHWRTLVLHKDHWLPIHGYMGQGLTMEDLTNLADRSKRCPMGDVTMTQDLQLTFRLYLSSLGLGSFVGPVAFVPEQTHIQDALVKPLEAPLYTEQIYAICLLILRLACHGYSVWSLRRKHFCVENRTICFSSLQLDEVTTVPVPCQREELETFAVQEFHVMLVSLATSSLLDSPWWSSVETKLSKIQAMFAEPKIKLQHLFHCFGLVNENVWSVRQTPIDIHIQTHLVAQRTVVPLSRGAIFDRARQQIEERAQRQKSRQEVQGHIRRRLTGKQLVTNLTRPYPLPHDPPHPRLTYKQASPDYPQQPSQKRPRQ